MNIDPCSLEARPLLTLAEALNKIYSAISALHESEIISLHAALGRILAVDLISPINLPTERNAAMDGYAFNSADVLSASPRYLQQVGISWAGKPFSGLINSGECVRIFTGAVVPEGADSVIMQEIVTVQVDGIELPAGAKEKQNIREQGEDVRMGACLLTAGTQLRASDLGLLAAAGISEVSVIRPLKIAFFSTGDELVPAGQPLMPGQIYDSNRIMLKVLCQEAGFMANDLGILADDPEQIENLLRSHAAHYDVLLSSGGASVGDADHIQSVLARCGQVNFWKIAIKPGKPLAFGQIGSSYFFGLPGNPLAVITTFQKIVLPALQRLSGAKPRATLQIKALCLDKLKKSPGRQEFQRGILSQNEGGDFEVRSVGAQGSHLLKSYSQANCYIVLDQDCQGVRAGEWVRVEPFVNE